MKENIHKIFENWNETIIWSCLQGIMGEIHTNLSEDAAMAILGDFAFYAGNPSEELVKYKIYYRTVNECMYLYDSQNLNVVNDVELTDAVKSLIDY